jgi:CRISPR-associated protein (TIGR03984 family)
MKVERIEGVPAPGADLRGWVAEQMTPGATGRRWLLAHFDDGVLWGCRVSDGSLLTAFDVAKDLSLSLPTLPEPRLSTLQQAFIFGESGEVRLWHDEDSWQARLITDPEAADSVYPDSNPWLDEEQLLWGDMVALPRKVLKEVVKAEDEVIADFQKSGFSPLCENRQQGLEHIVPLAIEKEKLSYEHRVRLLVRHYVTYDAGGALAPCGADTADVSAGTSGTGEARIALSRLVALIFD